MQYMILCDWLLLLSIRISRFIHVAACVNHSFLYYNQIKFHCMTIPHLLSILQLVDIRLFISITNNAVVSNCVQAFVWRPIFSSFGCMPRSGIAGSHSQYMFKLSRNQLIVFSTVAVPFQASYDVSIFCAFLMTFHKVCHAAL